MDRFGGLDILIANAVRWPNETAGPLGGVSWQAWQDAVRTNLEGTVDTVRAAIPHLVASGAGRIVLISSGVAVAAVLFLGSAANTNITGTYLAVSGGLP